MPPLPFRAVTAKPRLSLPCHAQLCSPCPVRPNLDCLAEQYLNRPCRDHPHHGCQTKPSLASRNRHLTGRTLTATPRPALQNHDWTSHLEPRRAQAAGARPCPTNQTMQATKRLASPNRVGPRLPSHTKPSLSVISSPRRSPTAIPDKPSLAYPTSALPRLPGPNGTRQARPCLSPTGLPRLPCHAAPSPAKPRLTLPCVTATGLALPFHTVAAAP